MTDLIFEDMRRAMMRGTTCTSQEATDFFAHLGLFFNDRAKQPDTGLVEAATFMALFDMFSKAVVELHDEL